MQYNEENIEIRSVLIILNQYIQIISKDEKKNLYLNFNRNKFDIDKTELYKTIDLQYYLYWDNSFETEKTYYLFDSSKDKIFLTKLSADKYRIEVDIENPDIIFCPLEEHESFTKLKIDTEFIYTAK